MATSPYERTARPWDLLNRELGRVDSQTARERLDICRSCPRLIKLTRQCIECGCFMTQKVRLPNASCPQGKWDQVDPPGQDADTGHGAAEPQQAGAREEPKKTVAFVIDEEVVAILAVNRQLAGILLSSPRIVEAPSGGADNTPNLKIGDFYPEDAPAVTAPNPG
ncbi:MAG TPA: hypothetical protein VI248_00635 [Kineosporiaceae bacterium]